MARYRLSLLSAAMMTAGVSSFVLAQETAPQPAEQTTEEQVEVIQVRGFAQSLFRSLDSKRFGDVVSETISADDLGALPDVSIADA